MMRIAAVSLALFAGSHLAAPVPARALAAGPSAAAGHAPAHARSASVGRERSARIALAPAPGELALAFVRFPHARRHARLSTRALQVGAAGPFGDDYLAAAAMRVRAGRSPVALVLLVNRVTAVLDPASVSVHVRSARGLGVPASAVLANPFAGALGELAASKNAAAPPCGLTTGAAPMAAGALTTPVERGSALPGFDAQVALAEAYDAVCGLADPGAPAFERAVHPSTCAPGLLCCPPNAICATPPSEPQPPGCVPPCKPQQGHACPLQARIDVCVAKLDPPRAAAAAAGAH
jgi:hypothetical protein